MSTSTPLQAALQADFSDAADLRARLDALGDYPIEWMADAELICSFLAELLSEEGLSQATGTDSPAMMLVGFFQDPATPETYQLFSEAGLPMLVALFDAKWPERDNDPDSLLLLLKIFGMYNYRPGLERIVTAAKADFAANDFMWSLILRQIDREHPSRHQIVSLLREPLPTGIIAAAYLNLCNQLSLAGELLEHPFNTAAGHDQLTAWLKSQSPSAASIAQVATTSLPFISEPPQAKLLQIACAYPDPSVQLEGAWARARIGDERGFALLRQFCLEPIFSSTACAYLKEYDREYLIPAEALAPDFQAAAELSRWLAHPMEYARPPDELALVDQRELNWPPTNDRRRFWLFRYAYQQEDQRESHFGLVGSLTFSLRTPTNLPPDDVYALHCCWELQARNDPRAPQELSVEHGRALLQQANGS